MVGSVWNNPRLKSPSRLRRDALRSQKFNAAKFSLDEATEKLSTSDHPKLTSFHSDCGNFSKTQAHNPTVDTQSDLPAGFQVSSVCFSSNSNTCVAATENKFVEPLWRS